MTVTTVADYVWAFDKPLVLRGGVGTWQWMNVLFASRTVDLRWAAKPATSAGCTFRFQLESRSLPKTIKDGGRTKSTKSVAGSRAATVKYGDGKVTVTSTCAQWTLKFTPTGHPGVEIKRDTDTTATLATMVSSLNDALADSSVEWWLRTNYRYVGTARPSVVSVRVTVDITTGLPKWEPPAGTNEYLVAGWNAALAGMKRHTQGEAVIAVQAVGRYLGAATKTKFTSVKAMQRYFDRVADKYLDWASARMQSYNEQTIWGETQGAFIH